MFKQGITGLVLVAAMAPAGVARAAEQVLKFRMVVHDVAANLLEAPNVADRTIGSFQAIGVAIFEDGRIAYKKFVRTENNGADSGEYLGYSTYTFQNGDSLTASFTGNWTNEGQQGDYQVLSGTGAYAGVTGTGHFVGVETDWDDAGLLEGSFTLDVPTN